MKIAIALCSTLLLNGCFFFYIPGPVIDAVGDKLTGSFGNRCIAESVSVGDRIRLTDGTYGTVTSISGLSSRCKDSYPIRAEVAMD